MVTFAMSWSFCNKKKGIKFELLAKNRKGWSVFVSGVDDSAKIFSIQVVLKFQNYQRQPELPIGVLESPLITQK